MMTTTPRKSIPAALLLAGACGLSSTVNASVYAIAYNNIFELNVTSNPLVPLADFTQFSATSAAAANLNGATAGGGSDSQGGPADSPLAIGADSVFNGAAPVNNGMTAEGQGGNYSYADSQISRTALMSDGGDPPVISLTGQQTQAWGIAEGYIASAGSADASTGNATETGFNSTINLQDATQFTFAFKAAPYMYVAMSADSIGVSSNSSLTVQFTIIRIDTGDTVFSWSPDGASGGGIGVAGDVDPFSLNSSTEVTTAGASAVYDPLASGAPNGTINPVAFGTFSATTYLLEAGSYTISFDMTENTNLRTRGTTTPTPVPGVLGLMALGLAGLGFSRRKWACS